MEITENQLLLVAARGARPEHGLYGWDSRAGAWRGRQLARVEQLSALAGHPRLPVVYGTAGTGPSGALHAWRIDAAGCAPLDEGPSGGAEPCHLALDPSGRVLVVTNYASGTLALQALDEEGRFAGPPERIVLSGSGPDADRQDGAHPHQAVFTGAQTFIVIDLGADLVRAFQLDPRRQGQDALKTLDTTPMPAGTGPRHGVVLPAGRLAISGELSATLLFGRLGDGIEGWTSLPGTRRTGPAKTRHTRNYPGDIQAAPDASHVYFANRGYDTLAVFDLSGPVPEMVDEIDTMTAWPQHILVRPDHVLIAGWDSDSVVALPTRDGRPHGSAHKLFDCPGAGWLHLHELG